MLALTTVPRLWLAILAFSGVALSFANHARASAAAAVVGQTVTISVTADGTTPYTYQWRKNGVDIPGATCASYSIIGVQLTDAGKYTAVVANSAGSAVSDNASVAVHASDPDDGGGSGDGGSSGDGGRSGDGGGSGGSGGAGGTAPFLYPASVARDNAGNLYVADSASNTIMQVTPAGVENIFAGSAGVAGMQDGTGTGALFNQPGGVAVDSVGNVYVADTGNAVIRKITSSGIVTTLAGSSSNRGSRDGTGSAAWFSSPAGVAVDTAGNVYVADAFNNTIRKVTSAGVVTTLAGSATARGDADGPGSVALFNCPTGVAVDAAGNVYVADAFNSTIRKITAAGAVTTLAGCAGIIGANDGTGNNALFNLPVGVAVDGGGNVYVADAGNALIRKVAPGGKVITVAGMAETAGFKDADGTGAMFNQPSGLTVDAAGTIYVADAGNAFLRKVSAGGAVTTLALTAGTSAGGGGGSGGSLGSGTSSSSSAPTSFQFATSVARDNAGNLYAVDSATNIIVKVTSTGGATILAGAMGVAGMQDGSGTNALFSRPGGVAVDSGGNVYVADAGNAVIRKVSSSGVVTTLAGSPSSRGSHDGSGSSAQFDNPSGVAVDAAGNVYVADTYNNSIRKVTSSGTVTTLAGSTTRGDADGNGSAAQFDNPTGVTVDASGNVYVADAFNATIRKITSAGNVTTLAGSAGIIGANNGTGINALFNLPIGVSVDNSGNVYVADTGNALIRKIAPGGTVTTVAGVAGVAGWADGTGINVLFNQPRGLATDGAGTIYVADTGNGRIRKIASDGMVVTPSIQATAMPAGGGDGSSGGSTGTLGQGSSGGSGASGGSGSASTGGGGGGAMEAWFVLTLALLGIARCRYRRL